MQVCLRVPGWDDVYWMEGWSERDLIFDDWVEILANGFDSFGTEHLLIIKSFEVSGIKITQKLTYQMEFTSIF